MQVYIHIMLSGPVHKTSLRDCHFMEKKTQLLNYWNTAILSTSFAV